jgi:hypothetical protein
LQVKYFAIPEGRDYSQVYAPVISVRQHGGANGPDALVMFWGGKINYKNN